MKSKYYTPTIGEFHVGFEYEEHDELHDNFTDENPIFKKTICDEYLEIQHVILDKIRVKHLDREDIQECGFKRITDTWYSTNIYSGGINIIFNDSLTEFQIDKGNPERSDIVFKGTIKNKSELKKLMQQLSITTEI